MGSLRKTWDSRISEYVALQAGITAIRLQVFKRSRGNVIGIGGDYHGRMNRSAFNSADAHRSALHLSLLFGIIYFVQGLAEPSEGLIAQPVRSLLRQWNQSSGQIAYFMAIVSAPWAIKPVYGLIIDFVPLLGSRRRSYLLFATAITAVTLLWLSVSIPANGATLKLLALLVVPTVAVAFSDVVIDALMVEKGQPLGLTGRLQSIQWGSMYAATVLAGSLGGWMTQHNRQDLGFLLCGLGATVSFVAAVFWLRDDPLQVSEPPENSRQSPATVSVSGNVAAGDSLRGRLSKMRRTMTSPQFLSIAVFIFLWNFNPYSSTIQQLHLTRQLHLSEQQYGHTVSLFSVGSIGACVVYSFVCRIIPDRWLLHLAIAGGVLSTLAYLLAYLLASGVVSTMAVSVFVGFAYMLGNLIQMDFAARRCPPKIAGSIFALLMSVANVSVILSTSLGGWIYESIAAFVEPTTAVSILICIGSATTASCWSLVSWFRRPVNISV